MTATTETTWMCDRCAATVVTVAADSPTGWGYLVHGTPPRADPNEVKRRHLCGDCLLSMSNWFFGVSK